MLRQFKLGLLFLLLSISSLQAADAGGPPLTQKAVQAEFLLQREGVGLEGFAHLKVFVKRALNKRTIPTIVEEFNRGAEGPAHALLLEIQRSLADRASGAPATDHSTLAASMEERAALADNVEKLKAALAAARRQVAEAHALSAAGDRGREIAIHAAVKSAQAVMQRQIDSQRTTAAEALRRAVDAEKATAAEALRRAVDAEKATAAEALRRAVDAEKATAAEALRRAVDAGARERAAATRDTEGLRERLRRARNEASMLLGATKGLEAENTDLRKQNDRLRSSADLSQRMVHSLFEAIKRKPGGLRSIMTVPAVSENDVLMERLESALRTLASVPATGGEADDGDDAAAESSGDEDDDDYLSDFEEDDDAAAASGEASRAPTRTGLGGDSASPPVPTGSTSWEYRGEDGHGDGTAALTGDPSGPALTSALATGDSGTTPLPALLPPGMSVADFDALSADDGAASLGGSLRGDDDGGLPSPRAVGDLPPGISAAALDALADLVDGDGAASLGGSPRGGGDDGWETPPAQEEATAEPQARAKEDAALHLRGRAGGDEEEDEERAKVLPGVTIRVNNPGISYYVVRQGDGTLKTSGKGSNPRVVIYFKGAKKLNQSALGGEDRAKYRLQKARAKEEGSKERVILPFESAGKDVATGPAAPAASFASGMEFGGGGGGFPAAPGTMAFTSPDLRGRRGRLPVAPGEADASAGPAMPALPATAGTPQPASRMPATARTPHGGGGAASDHSTSGEQAGSGDEMEGEPRSHRARHPLLSGGRGRGAKRPSRGPIANIAADVDPRALWTAAGRRVGGAATGSERALTASQIGRSSTMRMMEDTRLRERAAAKKARLQALRDRVTLLETIRAKKDTGEGLTPSETRTIQGLDVHDELRKAITAFTVAGGKLGADPAAPAATAADGDDDDA